jgi:diadenosine tetraphosphate (Ap4A) HIT family hydrolase
MPLYYLGNARSDDQREEMIRLEAAGICLFCPADQDPAARAPLWQGEHWTVVPNRYPYRGTRHHLLLIPHEHVADMVDLSEAARQEFWTALGWVRDRYELAHYGLAARNGDSRATGGTISHLHIHIVVGDVDDPDHTPVRMKLSSRPQQPV